MPEKSIAEILDETTVKCRNLDAPLAGRLQAFSDDIGALQPEFAAVMDRLVIKLQEVGAGEEAPAPGEAMPSFLLPDQDGHLLSLEELLERGPLAIAFHRGQWCPYCRINARALADIQGEVKALGAELIAITPNVERFNAELAADARANFPVLSDMDNAYALALNLAVYRRRGKKACARARRCRCSAIPRQRRLDAADPGDIRRRPGRPDQGSLHRSRFPPAHGRRGHSRRAEGSLMLTLPYSSFFLGTLGTVPLPGRAGFSFLSLGPGSALRGAASTSAA